MCCHIFHVLTYLLCVGISVMWYHKLMLACMWLKMVVLYTGSIGTETLLLCPLGVLSQGINSITISITLD